MYRLYMQLPTPKLSIGKFLKKQDSCSIGTGESFGGAVFLAGLGVQMSSQI
jgi:hypothetical protein